MNRTTLSRDDGERLCAIASTMEASGYPDDGRDARFLRKLGQDAIATAPETGEIIHMPRLIGKTFGVSTSEARRLLATGGVRVGGNRVTALDVARDEIDGQQLMLGLRRAVVVDLGPPEEST